MKKTCPVRACLISVLAVFVFLNLYAVLVHGHLLASEYTATASMWRSQEEMNNMFWGWLVYYALLSIVTTCWFKKTKSSMACAPDAGVDVKPSCCPIKSGGLCFGLKLGMVMGLGMASAYLYMPIPASLGIKWFFTGLFQGIGIGLVLGVTCRGSTSCVVTDNK